MSGERISDLAKFQAPYGPEILLQEVEHESGLRLLRIRIREKSRFTILDVDQPTAIRWAGVMTAWADTSNAKDRGH